MPDRDEEFTPLAEMMGRRQLWLLLATLATAMFMSGLNQQIVATATPRVVADLGGFDLLPWMFITYMLTATIVTPIVGKLSDTYGRKVFVLSGIVIFILGSAACGASPSMLLLVISRGVQGIGGGLVQASVITTIGDLFHPAQRAKYIVIFMGAGTAASLSGPTIGGIVTDAFGWRWCFLISVPVALVASTFVVMFMPSVRRNRAKAQIDVLGAALLSAAASSLLLALVWAQKEFGWSAPQTGGMFASAAFFTTLLTLQERRHPEAILPFHLFRNRDFVIATAIFTLMSCASQGTIAYLPTFVQVALGTTATASGLITTPQALASLVGGSLGGQLLARTGRYRWQVIIGLSIILSATALLQTLKIGDPEWHVSLFMVVLGLGSGVTVGAMSTVTLNTVSHQFIGVATGSRQFFSQIGVVMSTAIFGVILASSYDATFADDLSAETRAALPVAVVAKFDDPTISLDQRRFEALRTDVGDNAEGQAALDAAVVASKDAVATASRHIFLGASVITAIALLFAFLQREVPLRGRVVRSAQVTVTPSLSDESASVGS